MKINGRTLLPHEVALFNQNTQNSAGIRVIGLLADFMIFTLMLITVFTVGGYGVWMFNVIYSLLLILMVFGFTSFTLKEARQVDEVLRDRLVCYSNSAVDWPFGHLGLISTIKNFVVLLGAIPLAMAGHTFLAILLPLCWMVNNMTIYARGNLTLDVIDHVLMQGKYAT